MSGDAAIDGESVEVQITTAAYHEAGHIVVAAALGLPLRPEGIMIAGDGKGFACYWKEPDLTDSSVEANVLASFAGFSAEKRLRSMRGFQPREYLGVIWSTDWKEARALEAKFSNAYLGDKSIPAVHEELEAKADEIVAQYWRLLRKSQRFFWHETGSRRKRSRAARSGASPQTRSTLREKNWLRFSLAWGLQHR
jgi:hypothetical protein